MSPSEKPTQESGHSRTCRIILPEGSNTLHFSQPDGCLAVVSRDARRCLPADGVADTLQQAIERWDSVEPALRLLADRLEQGEGDVLDESRLLAPLPRAWQWLDGSAFPQHGELMQKAFNLPPIETDRPLMYQGLVAEAMALLNDEDEAKRIALKFATPTAPKTGK